QVAQKFKKTTFPSKSGTFTTFPLSSEKATPAYLLVDGASSPSVACTCSSRGASNLGLNRPIFINPCCIHVRPLGRIKKTINPTNMMLLTIFQIFFLFILFRFLILKFPLLRFLHHKAHSVHLKDHPINYQTFPTTLTR